MSNMVSGTKKLGGLIQQWQGPGSPGINHVGSYFTGGHPVTEAKAREAIGELRAIRHRDGRSASDRTELDSIINDIYGVIHKATSTEGGAIKGGKELAQRLSHWHGSMGDPVYAVSSNWDGGHAVKLSVVKEALSNLDALWSKRQAIKMPIGDVRHLSKTRDMLRELITAVEARENPVRGKKGLAGDRNMPEAMRAVLSPHSLPPGWKLAKGTMGMNLGDAKVYGFYYRGVALRAYKPDYYKNGVLPDGQPAAWSVGITGLMTTSGPTLGMAAERACREVDKAKDHGGASEFDQRWSRAKFDAALADTTRLYP